VFRHTSTIPSNTTPISYVHCGPFSLFVKRASLYSESIAVIAIFSDNAFSCPKPSCINSNKQLIIPICILISLLSLIFNFSLHYCTVNAFSDALCINALTSPTRHHQYSSIYYLDILFLLYHFTSCVFIFGCFLKQVYILWIEKERKNYAIVTGESYVVRILT